MAAIKASWMAAFAAACLAVAVFSGSPAAAQDEETGKWVDATGQAAGTDEQAKTAALKDAQLQAIKSACGEKISAQTSSADMGKVNELIVSRLSGYIRKYEITDTKVADDKTTVSIRALVDRDTATDDIAAIQYAAQAANDPRIAIVIAQVTNDLFEDTVKNRSVDHDIQLKLEAEKRRFDDAQAASLYELDQNATRVRGNFGFWNRRPRPRNWSTWNLQERSAWIRSTSETEYRNAVAEIKGSESVKKRKSSWNKITDSVEANGAVQAAIEKYFIRQGLNVVSQSQTELARQREIMLAGLSGNPDEVTAIRAKLGADIIITGTATAKRVSDIAVGDAKLYRYQGELVIRAYNADNGKMLAAEQFSQPINSTSPTGGTDDALRAVAKKAAAELADDIAKTWSKQWRSGSKITVAISGMAFPDWVKFKAAVQDWPRIKQVQLRSITAGRADIEITTDLDAEYIAGRMMKIKKPAIEITGFERNNIRGKIKN